MKGGWAPPQWASPKAAASVRSISGRQTPGAAPEALEAILRLSLPSNDAITSPHVSGNVLLVRVARQPLCLDEAPPSDVVARGPLHEGGKVVAPVVIHRVEPMFPESARRSMGRGSSMEIIIESLISREGCIRNLRLIAQTPDASVNVAALTALSQWTFKPGTLDGEPVDVIFNITMNFRTN